MSKGELQVSEKERKANLESSSREVATIVADKCINPDTERPYPVTMIEKALKDLHFAIKPNKNAKQLVSWANLVVSYILEINYLQSFVVKNEFLFFN